MSNPIADAESRLRAWVRDYGKNSTPAFVADVTALLDALNAEAPCGKVLHGALQAALIAEGNARRAPQVQRWTFATGGIYFGRRPDGNVVIAKADKAPESGGAIEWWVEVDSGIWGSIVLCLSYFDERPRDWQAFMDHHIGRRDLLQAAKDCETLQETLERVQREDERRAGEPIYLEGGGRNRAGQTRR